MPEFDYYYLQAIAKMDLIDEDGETFLIRKGETAVLQYFPNRKEAIVTHDFGVVGTPFFLPYEQFSVFKVYTTAIRVERFH